jgi:glycosyltransferase involved in cell wall biosynthesis
MSVSLSNSKVSVAIATYNGEKFVAEQIRSVLNQSRLVDQIVICDDRSTDSTYSILREHSHLLPPSSIISCNNERLGVVRNFEKALFLCTGDVIFLADQDDVWYYNKVEACMSLFEENSSAGLVFSNAGLIDSDGLMLMGNTFNLCSFKPVASALRNSDQVKAFLLNPYSVLGMSMCMTREVLGDVLPFPSILCGKTHDTWILMTSLVKGHSVAFTYEKLLSYRIHDFQVSQPFAGRIQPQALASRYKCSLRDLNFYVKLLRLSHSQASRLQNTSTVYCKVHCLYSRIKLLFYCDIRYLSSYMTSPFLWRSPFLFSRLFSDSYLLVKSLCLRFPF